MPSVLILQQVVLSSEFSTLDRIVVKFQGSNLQAIESYTKLGGRSKKKNARVLCNRIVISYGK